jgi:hypothetical protein
MKKRRQLATTRTSRAGFAMESSDFQLLCSAAIWRVSGVGRH